MSTLEGETLGRWLRQVSLGKSAFEGPNSRLALTRAPAAVALALSLADMRVDLAWAESEGEAAEATAWKRKVELADDQLMKALEALLNEE